MIITTNNPRHRELGKKIEVATRRMAFLSQFVQSQKVATGRLAAFLEDMEDNADPKEDLELVESVLNLVRNTIGMSSELFEKHREEFQKLDVELQKLTRKAIEKELAKPVTPPPAPQPLPPVPGIPPLQPPPIQ
jgi:chromosome segregation ATPase